MKANLILSRRDSVLELDIVLCKERCNLQYAASISCLSSRNEKMHAKEQQKNLALQMQGQEASLVTDVIAHSKNAFGARLQGS